jgi:hypothetical protein
MTTSDNSRDTSLRAASLLLGLAMAVCFLAYRPGLSGTFQLDDHPNLSTLEALKDEPTADQFAQFLLKGIASPLGRPVSLMSFAVQAGEWPDNPGAFILGNILLHLVNGTLLFWWLLRVARLRGDPGPDRLYVPLAATVIWLIAPIQASAVLYVVQRMTELAATFVFLGMGLYLVGRERMAAGAVRPGLTWMSVGMLVGAGLGTLAKENAAQMPLMVLALECTLLAHLPRPRAWRLWAAPFLAAPALALLAYVAWTGLAATGYWGRDFTPVERLLSEPRALFMYLHKMLAPWPSAIRLLYDDFPASRGLLSPWTTSVAIAALAGFAFAAWKLRTAVPMFAFAVLWFLSCHVLESSALPLELVFEHRNYQASAGVWLALAADGALVIRRASSQVARSVFAALAAAYLVLHATVTWQVATLWGRPLELAAWTAAQLPDSARAQQGLVTALIRAQLPFDAAMAAERAATRWPDNPSFSLLTMTLACQLPEIPFPAPDGLAHALRTTPSHANAVADFTDALVSLVEEEHCPVGLPVPLSTLTAAALSNAALGTQRQNLLLLHSRALQIEGRIPEARATFTQAIDVRPQMILLIQATLNAVTDGDLALARRHLERARTDPRIRRKDRWSHRNDLPLLEELVRSREAGASPQ